MACTMASPLRLEDYDVSPKTGFLPEEPPLTRLPDPYYAPWERLNDNLRDYLITGTLRQQVEKMPVLSTDRLSTVREKQRGFNVLAFVAHTYVWYDTKDVRDSIPPCLAVPWTTLASDLGLNPVICSASAVVWNWRLLDPQGPRDLSNMTTVQTFTGSFDESWFYLITAAVEARSAPVVGDIPEFLAAIDSHDHAALLAKLQNLHQVLSDLPAVLNEMYRHCDPYVFYWRIHPYLAGWSNMASAGLPHGLLYRGVDDCDVDPTDEAALRARYRQYAGGSAAQSSVIQVFDIILGIHHGRSSSINKDDSPGKASDAHGNVGDYLLAMRQYMPGPHREFLEELGRRCHLRAYVADIASPAVLEALREADPREVDLRLSIHNTFNACVAEIKRFRDAHIQMVARYVISPARRGKAESTVLQPRSTPASLDSTVSLTPPNSERPSPRTNSPMPTVTTLHSAFSAPVSDFNGDAYSAGQSSDHASLDLPASTTWPPPLSPSDRTSSVFSFSSWRRLFTGSDRYTEPVTLTPAPSLPSLDCQSRSSSECSSVQLFRANQGPMSKPHQQLSSTLATSINTVPIRQAIVGAGGTSAMHFIKQARDNTKKGFL